MSSHFQQIGFGIHDLVFTVPQSLEVRSRTNFDAPVGSTEASEEG